jgi:hypothetical protein
MSDRIASSTKVYIWLTQPTTHQRIWLKSAELVVNHRGEKVLRPTWDDELQFANSWTYEYAAILRRRLLSEGFVDPNVHNIRFSLNPTGESVGNSDNAERSLGDDTRTVMFYRGLIVRPGFDVKLGRVWYLKFPGHIARESLRGSTVEEVVDRCHEMGLQASAEQAPPPPAPEPERKINQGPRQRPGDRY